MLPALGFKYKHAIVPFPDCNPFPDMLSYPFWTFL